MRMIVISLAGLCVLAGGRVAVAEQTAVALPTQLAGAVSDRATWQRDLEAGIDAAIHAAGRKARAAGPLTAAEASCHEAACLARIAESADADVVLSAKITADRGSPPSYKLVLVSFERERPGTVKQEEAECSVCTEQETVERLTRMVSARLPAQVVPPKPAPIVSPAPELVVAAPVAPKGPSRKTLLALLGATSAVTIAGVVLVGAGARGLVLDGRATSEPSDGTPAPLVYDTHAAGAGMLAAGSVLVVGSIVGIVLEARLLKRRPR